MIRPTREQKLRDYLAGTSSPQARATLEAELAADPELAADLARLAQEELDLQGALDPSLDAVLHSSPEDLSEDWPELAGPAPEAPEDAEELRALIAQAMGSPADPSDPGRSEPATTPPTAEPGDGEGSVIVLAWFRRPRTLAAMAGLAALALAFVLAWPGAGHPELSYAAAWKNGVHELRGEPGEARVVLGRFAPTNVAELVLTPAVAPEGAVQARAWLMGSAEDPQPLPEEQITLGNGGRVRLMLPLPADMPLGVHTVVVLVGPGGATPEPGALESLLTGGGTLPGWTRVTQDFEVVASPG